MNTSRPQLNVGRNSPCPCGSGLKYKRCHGGFDAQPTASRKPTAFEAEMGARARRIIQEHAVHEHQRKKQQGLGRPIISAKINGHRFVAVGGTPLFGKWKTFPDFLGDYIKRAMDEKWGSAEIAKPLEERHPLLVWYDKICRLQAEHIRERGVPYSMPLTGAVSAYHRLAYNLYLLAHNGRDIQTRLIERLKNKDNFQGAYFEAQVAAWMINAGFELEFEDETDRSEKHCEFTATHITTGTKYSVEAKSRATETTASSRPKVRKKLHEALEKAAKHPRLVFINLNKPLHNADELGRAFDLAKAHVKQSEAMQINGVAAPPAYVCITNVNDQYSLETTTLTLAAQFQGFKIPDFMADVYPSIRDAVRARDRHAPLFDLKKSMEEHCSIPQTFDGDLPSYAFGDKASPRLRVGQTYLVTGPTGTEVQAVLTQAIVVAAKAHGLMRDPKTGEVWQSAFDMSADELADYAAHPDTYFGVYRPVPRTLESAVDLFDFFLESHKRSSREELLEMLAGIGGIELPESHSDRELLEILAERYALHVMKASPKSEATPNTEAAGDGDAAVRGGTP